MGSKITAIVIVVSFLTLFSGCTLWRQATKPATWGMSLPELWEYEEQQRHIIHTTIRVSNALTGEPIKNTELIVMPRPAIYPLGMPKNKVYRTDDNGLVSLHHLPSRQESWISISGENSVINNLLESGEILIGDLKIRHVKE